MVGWNQGCRTHNYRTDIYYSPELKSLELQLGWYRVLNTSYLPMPGGHYAKLSEPKLNDSEAMTLRDSRTNVLLHHVLEACGLDTLF